MIHHVENHIEKMREKPEHVRKQYAFLTSLGVTMIIFMFWVASFSGSFALDSAVVATEKAEVKSPISSLTANVGDAFGYVKDMIFGANQAKYESEIEVVPGRN
ncbi:MAG: hypothetical protein Q8Q03_01870 [bacterium]|nr:hypothetical protein [bacterium]